MRLSTLCFACLVATASIQEAACSSKKFNDEDLGEIARLGWYMIARFAKGLEPSQARRVGEEARTSPYVSGAYNLVTGERVIDNEMVKEAIGDICYFNSKTVQGNSQSIAEEKELDCEDSAYTNYNWEEAIYEGKWTPSKDLIATAAGDVCYVFSKYIFGYEQARAEEVYEECRNSHYIEYVYDAFDKRDFVPESRMIGEALGDICFHTCQLDRRACLKRERRCEKTKYVDLIYNLVQGKNRFTNEVLDKIAFDACYWANKLIYGATQREAWKSGKKCQKHNMTKMIKPVIQLVLDLIGWPLADDLDDDYPNY